MNSSQQFVYQDSRQENIMFSAYYTLILAIAVPGNSLALWTFRHQESTSPFDIFLRNLAVSDIFHVLILPVRVVCHLSDHYWPFSQVVRGLINFLYYLNMYCSIYLMSFISIDRFLAVVFPIRSQSVRKISYAKVGAGVLWVTLILGMSPTLFINRGSNTNSSTLCSKLYLEESSLTSLVSTVAVFAVPFTTIFFSYMVVLWKLQHVKQRHVKEKSMKMAILIPTNFLLAFLPFHVCRCFYIARHNRGLVIQSLATANRVTSALTCVSGILDPVMYFFLNRAYSEKLLQTFKMGTFCSQ